MPDQQQEWQKVDLSPEFSVTIRKYGFEKAKMVLEAPKGEFTSKYVAPDPTLSRKSRRTTLDRGLRVNNRSIKQRRGYSDPTGRSVLRYTTG